ncbi:ABC transporter substrate-binding protein [Ancylobacter sonchi]|uniref:ABC transporter substrate-binding protein n=1 Tax=Ancylobacter sonchi TaxID=1937790 RepID=UPI001BD1E2A9|nr:ABC transporter substrate-binding protein [Ancylobacter sonchi]MBS7534265.1 ABC transporter substrate-binding protein [Ancylobacter sonchi]
MHRKTLLALSAVPALLISATLAQADDLVIMSSGGAWQAAQRQAWFEPFAKEKGVKVVEQEFLGDLAKVKAMVDTKSTSVDLVTLDADLATVGCDSGILEKIDYSKIADRASYGGSAFDCAVGLDVTGTVVGYDPTVLKDEPIEVSALFDLQRWPGRRGIRKAPQSTLEFALIADGVAADKVYEVLGTPEGIDRAFKKLDTIKKDIVWWEAGAQPAQLLASREVVMSTAWNGRIYNAVVQDKKPFKIAWKGQMLQYDVVSIPKGAPHPELAYQYLAYVAKPENNVRITNYIPYGPVVAGATELADPAILPHLPNAKDHLPGSFELDAVFWADHGEELTKRFNTWLSQ